MNIGTTIKKLRRGRDMTQEQLAEYLNVSVSAVSQWESDKTSPDLSVIPSICNLFSVTSDELLGIDLNKKEQNAIECSNNAHKYLSFGYYEEARIILENGLKLYPDDYHLMFSLMDVYYGFRDSTTYTEDEKLAYLKKAIILGEKIINGCNINYIRNGAIQILCFSYNILGDIDKAVKLAQTMPTLAVSSELLLSRIGKGDIKFKRIQFEVILLFDFFINDMLRLNTLLDSGTYKYSPDEEADIRDKQIKIIEIFFENKDFGFFNSTLSSTHVLQAKYYASHDDIVSTLYHLNMAANHAIEFVKCNGMIEHTSLISKGYGKNEKFGTNNNNNHATRVLEDINDNLFDFIRSEPEFIQIEENLKQYAGKWPVQ
jgi:Predicted transcriptional regulators